MKGNISYSCVDEIGICTVQNYSLLMSSLRKRRSSTLSVLSVFVYSVQCCQSEVVGLNVENIRFKLFIFLPFGDTIIANVAFQGSHVWIDFLPSIFLNESGWFLSLLRYFDHFLRWKLSCRQYIQGPKRILHVYYRVNSAKSKRNKHHFTSTVWMYGIVTSCTVLTGLNKTKGIQPNSFSHI